MAPRRKGPRIAPEPLTRLGAYAPTRLLRLDPHPVERPVHEVGRDHEEAGREEVGEAGAAGAGQGDRQLNGQEADFTQEKLLLPLGPLGWWLPYRVSRWIQEPLTI